MRFLTNLKIDIYVLFLYVSSGMYAKEIKSKYSTWIYMFILNCYMEVGKVKKAELILIGEFIMTSWYI